MRPLPSGIARGARLVLAFTLLFGALPACGATEDASSEAGFWLDIHGLAQKSGALDAGLASSFRVSVHATTPPEDGEENIIFDSGCNAIGSTTAFRVAPLEVGTSRSVRLDIYSDAACSASDSTYRAYRGNLTVEADVDRIYVLVPYKVDGFTPLPLPSTSTMSKASNTACQDDSDCRTRVHAASFCVSAMGVCALTSLHPLNNFAPRAMHRSVQLADGTPVSIGGIGQASSNGALLGTDVTVETYSPELNLFEVRGVSGYSGEVRLAFHEVVPVDNTRVLVLGGIQSVILARDGTRLAYDTPVQFCSGPGSCTPNILNQASVLDLAAGQHETTTLPSPVYGAKAIPIPGDAPTWLVIGGTVADDDKESTVPSDQIVRCRVSNTTVECSELKSTLSVPRAGHALACLDEDDDGGCKRVLILGGYGLDPDDAADVYDVDEGKLSALKVKGDGVAAGGWSLVDVGGVRATLGGTTGELGSPPDIVPQIVTVGDDEIRFDALPLTGVDDELTFRAFPAVAKVGSGSVLLLGGLDEENNATSSVLRFDVGGSSGSTTVDVSELQMAVPRFGHSVVAIGRGELDGSLLIQGGLVLRDAVLQFASGAELFAAAPAN